MSRIAAAIETTVKAELLAAVASPSSGLGSATPALDAANVARGVSSGLAAVIDNLSNAEPWYRSRVTLGAAVAIVLPLLRLAGVKTESIDPGAAVDVLLSLGAAIGGGLAIYGRYVGRKPIGA